MVRSTISRFAPVFAASAGVLLLAACGGGSTPVAQTSTSSSPTSSESPTTTATTASPTTSSSATPAAGTAQADGLCKAGDVKLSLGQGDAGAGSVYRPLLITNIKPAPCTIQGFPG